MAPARKKRTRKLAHKPDPSQPLRVVGYIRVSTAHQKRSGLSLAAQRKKLKAYCEMHDFELVSIIEDGGQSAASLRRPGLQRVLALMEAHHVDGLVIAKLDRLTRSLKDLGSLLDKYFKNGWRLMSVADHIDTDSAAGRMVLNVLMSVAQWEREAIGERVADACAEKRANGEKTGGDVPFGFRVSGKKLLPVKKEQDIIKQAKRLRSRGHSYQSIADRLTTKGRTQRNGKPFHAIQVSRMLKRAEAQG